MEDGLWEKINSEYKYNINDGARDGNGRFNFHFYDPQNKEAGLSIKTGVANTNALYWAIDGSKAVMYSIALTTPEYHANDYSYMRALEYYRKLIAEPNFEDRKKYRAKLFVSLGYLLHVLNDMDVPAHTRDDAHPLGDPLEVWMRGEGSDHSGFRINGSILDNPNKEILNAVEDKKPTQGQRFSDFYTNEAEFTGNHFYSEDSISVNGGTFGGYSKYNPLDVTLYDGDGVGFISSKSQDISSGHKKLAMMRKNGAVFADVLKPYYYSTTYQGKNDVFIDNGVNLVPRAVANAEGFVNFFFRGRIAASINNGKLKIANISDKNLVGENASQFDGEGYVSIFRDDDFLGIRTRILHVKLGKSLLAYQSGQSLLTDEIRTFDLPEELRLLSDEEAKKLVVVYEGKIGVEDGISATTVDPMRDMDNDGMPDFWEVEHHLDITKDDSALDLDGDGVSNIDEYKAGTDPSVKEIEPQITANAGKDGEITLSWAAVTNAASYTFCYATESITDINKCTTYANGKWGNTATPGATVSGLTNGTPYYFRMVAFYNGDKRSRVSNEATATPVKAKLDDGAFSDPTVNTEHNVKNVGLDTADGTLKLALDGSNTVDATFPYIWIANSGEGTISKLDVKTGAELGRYRTGPGNGNPSRTTVDQDGNVWVGNRNNNTITKVGLKEFDQCIDRNGNGVIDTSTGKNDVKSWGGYFGDGQGITNAEDECILQHVSLTAPGVSTPTDIRLIAIDKDNNVFTGGHYVNSLFKVNGRTGQIVGAVNTIGSVYGGLIDKAGNLWASSRGTGYGQVINVSSDLQTQTLINAGVNVYGIAISKYGEIWVSDANAPQFASFSIIDPTGTLKTYSQVGRGWQPCYAQGIAVSDDDIFIAGCRDSYDHVVGHYKRASNGSDISVQHVANYTVGGGATGVAIDGQGHVWSANEYTDSVSRIILATESSPLKIDTFPVGSRPYNYSDMTGRVVRTITKRQGTWEATFNGKAADYPWNQVSWKLKSALPAGTSVKVFAKVANTEIGLNAQAYAEVQNGQALSNLTGQYLKVKVELASEDLISTPEVIELQLY